MASPAPLATAGNAGPGRWATEADLPSLLAHASVTDAVVVGAPDHTWGKRELVDRLRPSGYPALTPDRWLADYEKLPIRGAGASVDPEGERGRAARPY